MTVRIVSLVPGATELLFALGLGDRVVGVSHGCDHPAPVRALPHVTRDGAIRTLDEGRVAALEPSLIVTQRVGAVPFADVQRVAAHLPSAPRIVALDPRTLGEAMGDIRTIAQATGARDAALDLVARLRSRIDAVKIAVRARPRRTVAAIEWFDPVCVAGYWTPQLIDLAGGTDVLGFAGEPSEQLDWETVAAARPELVLSIPRGHDAGGSLALAHEHRERLQALGAREVLCLDASAYFSHPGPRLVDGLETLAHALHPEAVPSAPGRVLRLGPA